MTSLEILHQAGIAAGVDTDGARLLRAHSASVYLLPRAHAVARLSCPEHPGLRPSTGAAVAAWLGTQHFPVTEPLVDHGIVLDGTTVTFWHHYPQGNTMRPGASELGRLLRWLHELPTPPIQLRQYQPLLGLRAAVSAPNMLSESDRAWLTSTADELVEQYNELESELGVAFVHGDAYPGNTLWGHDGRVLLGDWDEVSIAPRELDLVNTYQGVRFGRSESELDSFTHAYGWDVRTWAGFRILRDLRDLHTLGGFISRSGDDPAAAAELDHRLETLRRGEPANRPWHAA